MPPENYFTAVFAAIIDLLARHSDLFLAMGQNMFRSFAVILIAWFGIRTALDGEGFRFANFVNLVMVIAFGYAMVTYYDTPIPGFGRAFKDLVIDQAVYLSNRLEAASLGEVQERLVTLYSTMEPPSLFDWVYIVRYFITMAAIILAQVAVLAVVSYGYVAMAVIVLVGPIFIPFFIVPKLEWLFWGWLRCFLQYSFYQVVAHAFVFVFGQLVIHFLDIHPPPFDALKVAWLFVPLVFLLLSFVYGVLKIPSLVNGIFTGRAGDTALPRALT